jgi:aconitate hydratase 2/2-methylisocitrate dehydratase
VYLGSAELSAVAAVLGKLPTPAEYLNYAKDLDSMASELYRYLNFNEIKAYQDRHDEGKRIASRDL